MSKATPKLWEDAYTVAFGIVLILVLAAVAYTFFPDPDAVALQSVPAAPVQPLPGDLEKQAIFRQKHSESVDRAVGELERQPQPAISTTTRP